MWLFMTHWYKSLSFNFSLFFITHFTPDVHTTPHLHIYSSSFFLSHLLPLSLSLLHNQNIKHPSTPSLLCWISISPSHSDFSFFNFPWRVIISITITGNNNNNNIIINNNINNNSIITTLITTSQLVTWMPRIGSPNGASRRQKSSSWSVPSWIRLSWIQRGTNSFGKSSPPGWRKRVSIKVQNSASASGKTSLPAIRYYFYFIL